MAGRPGVKFIFEFVADKKGAADARKEISKTTQATKKGAKTVGDANKKITRSFNMSRNSMAGLALKAIKIIPIWITLRQVYLSFFNTVRDGTQHIIALDKALARAGSVTAGPSNVGRFLNDTLGPRAKQLSAQTGTAIDEVVEGYFRFGTAGLNAQESLAGMNTALKLSIATMGDNEETAKTLADIYNLMGDRMEGASTPAEKFNRIAANTALLFKNNAFEQGEFSAAMQQFVPIATTANLTLEETMATVAALSSLMQRGSKGGTQLASTFVKLSQRTPEVEAILGKDIDLDSQKPFDVFLQVLEKLNKELKEGDSVSKDIADIFGLRAFRATGAFVTNLGKLTEELKRLEGATPDQKMAILNEMFENQVNVVERQLNITKELMNQNFAAFFQGLTGDADAWTATLKAMNSQLEKMIGFSGDVGNFFNIWSSGAAAMLGMNTASQDQRAAASRGVSDDVGLINRALGGELNAQGIEAVLKQLIAGNIKLGNLQKDKVLKGLNDILVATREQEKLTGEIKDNTIETKPVVEEILATDKERALMMERLAAFGASRLKIELAILSTIKDTKQHEDQRLKVIKQINSEIVNSSNKLRQSIEGTLFDFSKGEANLRDSLTRVTTFVSDEFRKSIITSFTGSFFEASGIGEMFGVANFDLTHAFEGPVGKIKGGFDYGARITRDAIIDGFRIGLSGGTAGGGAGTAGGLSKIGGLLGSLRNATGFGFGPEDLYHGNAPRKTGAPDEFIRGKMRSKSGLPGGFSLGQAATAAFSINELANLHKFKGGNVLGGATSGAISGFALGNALLPGIGGIIGAIGGGALGAFQGGKSKTEIFEERQTLTISSKIDVTNKELSIVNRNLIALQSSIETFILPLSAFFSENRGQADDFALSAKR